MSAPLDLSHDLSVGAHMVASDGRALPLVGVELRAHAEAGLARVTLRQQFHNPHAEPLRVRYMVPLPADAAVGGYVFELPGERIIGEIARKADARERFERALIEGRSAALLEQQRTSVFEQEVGNIPPGALITTELTLDQPLAWLAEGAWEWRFPTVVAPRYLGPDGALPLISDAAKLDVAVLDGPVPVGVQLSLEIDDALTAVPESPSHALRQRQTTANSTTIGFADAGGQARLDRDVVVRWRVATQEPGVRVALARGAHDDRAMGILTIIPPAHDFAPEPVARELILLIDTSGSMHGEPLGQARRVIDKLIAGLTERDRLEMIAFSSSMERWNPEPIRCDARTRDDARSWVACLQAGGGTRMHTAILEALAPLRADAQRQILLVSDGLIGFEREILAATVERLPVNSRVHCLGVGHGVNRSLTQPLARAGHGVELIIAPGEDPDRVVGALLERTAEPLLIGLELEGPALVQDRLLEAGSRGDLFAGTPTRIAIACRPEGGRLTVRARSAVGEWIEHLEIPPTLAGVGDPALIRQFAREQVEDLETLICAGLVRDGDARIESLGLGHGIATRMTSWIAVSTHATVDPTAPSRTVEQPHELAAGLSAEGVGLRPPSSSRGLGTRDDAGAITGKSDSPRILGFIQLPSGPPRDRLGTGGSANDAPGRATARKQREETSRSPTRRPKAGPAEPPAAAPPAPSARTRGPGPVQATIVIEDAKQLVLTFVAPTALPWAPGEWIELRIAGASISVRVRVRTDLAATTKPGSYAAGVTLRLAFTLDAPLPPGELSLAIAALILVASR